MYLPAPPKTQFVQRPKCKTEVLPKKCAQSLIQSQMDTRQRNRTTLAHGFAHAMYIKIQHIVMHAASSAAHTRSAGRESRSSRGCWMTLRKWKKFRGQKCLEIASLSQRPPKHTESYSSHLHLHLQTNFSHSRYSKQTSF